MEGEGRRTICSAERGVKFVPPNGAFVPPNVAPPNVVLPKVAPPGEEGKNPPHCGVLPEAIENDCEEGKEKEEQTC